jgi:cardiolipin synthase
MRVLKKLLFNRAILIALSIILQLITLISVIIQFNDYFIFFYSGSIFLSIAALIWIINSNSNPAYKIGWIIPILLFPIFGGLFYVFFGRKKLSKRKKDRMQAIQNKTKNALLRDHFIEYDALECGTAKNQSKYINDYAYYPPYKDTYTEYLSIGEVKFERLKEELNKAQHYIFLEYFIIEEGVMWNSILDILVEKVKAGVDVRVIYDDVGCLLTLPSKYYKKLNNLGIKCCVFNPLIPVLTPRLNNRDHRKITIIDGHTGFTGGINLADEYINEFQRFGHWKDSAIMIKGQAVWNLTVMFLSMWDYLNDSEEDFESFRIPIHMEQESMDSLKKGYVQPFADSPLDDEAVGEAIYLNLINKAEKYVYITTPYLIIDDKMLTALITSAKGGVDVRIITPYVGDKWFVHTVTRSYYKTLIENGVKIYEYVPGFIHSKTFVVDDLYGVVGTINMDYRSFYLHFECGIWMYEDASIIEMKKDFMEILALCKEITKEDVKSIKWYRSLIRLILRVFAPLM